MRLQSLLNVVWAHEHTRSDRRETSQIVAHRAAIERIVLSEDTSIVTITDGRRLCGDEASPYSDDVTLRSLSQRGRELYAAR